MFKNCDIVYITNPKHCLKTTYLIRKSYVFLPQSGQLNEYTERKEMSADVVCMSLANVPPGEQRSRFLAVGLVDNTVRIISLDPSVSSCTVFALSLV